MNSHRLQCRCGQLRGHVALPAPSGRAVCYCRDCQAFGRWLGGAGILDAAGGTDIVATMPSHVRFEQGLDALACMSLSPKGLLRWYASCCRTPIGNTPREPKMHYVGLVHSCLEAQPLEPSFGPVQVRLNTGSVRGAKVESTPLGALLVVAKLMTSMVPARLTGRWRDTPFFGAGGAAPVRTPEVPSRAEVAQLKGAGW